MPLIRQAQGLGRLILLAVVVLPCILLFYGLSNQLSEKRLKADVDTGSRLTLDRKKSASAAVSQHCADRYDIDYLEHFRDRSAEYCSSSEELRTQSRLTCFSNNVDPKGAQTDSFCVAGPAIYDVGIGQFKLDCLVKSISDEDTERGAQPFNHFPAYWYETGPSYIFKHYINMKAVDPSARDPSPERGATLILIKREDANFNMWHSLMEIMSAYWSLTILSQTTDPGTGHPYYNPATERAQVMILDDIEDGPWFDLWNIISTSRPSRRLTSTNPSLQYSNPAGKLVVPLPGGSNPFWQGDWVDIDCNSSILLDDFSSKVLAHYNIQHDQTRYGAPITITYIDRTMKRKLLHQDYYIASLREAYPYVVVNLVDFADYTFKEQLKISATTDILVGVHGAGLTHVMFMSAGSAIVEFMPFSIEHKGFKNMAKMRGVAYFGAQTADKNAEIKAKGNWQDDDVWVSEEAFLAAVEEAIAYIRARNGS